MATSNYEHLGGIFPALPTPMTASGEVDVQGLEKLVDHVVRGGVHGLWVLGSTSEFPALSAADRKLVIEVTLSCAKGRVPAIVGATDNDPRTIIANAKAAQSAGAAACFMTLPYYFIVDQQEAIRHVRQIAAESPLPVFLYDNPPSTGIRLSAETLLEMSECPNLIGLKDSSCDFVRFQNSLVMMRKKRPFKIFQGIDQLAGVSLMLGADGGILALASVAPTLFVRLYNAARANDLENLIALSHQVLQLCRLYQVAGDWTDGAFFMGMKAALQVLGISGRVVSRPFHEMPEDKMAEVEKLLQQCGASGVAG
jgi:dihydrodipicolinate synthase/N-acetylneuraminate lyase